MWRTSFGATAALCFCVLMVAACGNPARTTAIVAPVTGDTLLAPDSPLRRSVSVGQVTGGDRGNEVWQSEISSDTFREALETSMNLTGMLGDTSAPMVVDVTLEQVDSPQLDINLEVITTIYYRVRSTRNNAIVWQERVVAPFTAEFTESFVRSERLRLAAEGSARTNIAMFLKNFITASKANPYDFVN